MILKVLGSNSAGNCYILETRHEALIIELGVSVPKIKKALNFNIAKVVGAIVSHSHGDHAKYMGDMMKCGIDVYASRETMHAKYLHNHHKAKYMVAEKKYKIGGFSVKGFPVEHDVPCMMFLIEHEECGLTLFLTDTMYCRYTIPGLNNIIIECNHDLETLDNSNTPGFLRNRIIQSHMNLDTCKEMLLANDLSAVHNIVLIHLSKSNSNAGMIKQEISNMTGKVVHIADEGLTIENFNKAPF